MLAFAVELGVGTGTFELIPAPGAGKCLRIHTIFASVYSDVISARGSVEFDGGDILAPMIGNKYQNQILYAMCPPIVSPAANKKLQIVVSVAGFGGTAHVWGAYEIVEPKPVE